MAKFDTFERGMPLDASAESEFIRTDQRLR